MYLKTVKVMLLFFLFCAIPCVGQTKEDAQKQREELEAKAIENFNERVKTFLSDLTVDDFQKEIIKQKLESYYAKKKIIYTDGSLKYYERDEKLNSLDNYHFDDIKNMITEDKMDQIQVFIKDAGTTLEKQKKKKKKNKRNKDE
jgi:agmatine/peptidylarginine deiminase